LFVFREGSSGGDPCSKEFDLRWCEVFTFAGGRHAFGILGSGNSLKHEALFGISGNDGRPGFAAFEQTFAEVQSESCGLFECAMAGGALLGEQGLDLLLVEVIGRREGRLERGCEDDEDGGD
jgi:hypothetical protein